MEAYEYDEENVVERQVVVEDIEQGARRRADRDAELDPEDP